MLLTKTNTTQAKYMISDIEQRYKENEPELYNKFINFYLIKLLNELQAKGYSVVAGYGKHASYKYSKFNYSDTVFFYRVAREHLFSGARNLFVVCCNNLLALDIDKPHEQEFLDCLLDKYKLNPNQIVKTQNGYHYYFNVSYPVASQNTGNNQIAIKCNGASMTAPNSVRYDKNYRYIVTQGFIAHSRCGYIQPVKEITKLPFDAYQELRDFNKRELPKKTKPTKEKYKTMTKYKNKPVAEYLANIDKTRYLFGDWDNYKYIMNCCKQADPNCINDVYNWARAGIYSEMEFKEFSDFWDWLDPSLSGIDNPFAVLQKLAKG
jgi:hypothetical protein